MKHFNKFSLILLFLSAAFFYSCGSTSQIPSAKEVKDAANAVTEAADAVNQAAESVNKTAETIENGTKSIENAVNSVSQTADQITETNTETENNITSSTENEVPTENQEPTSPEPESQPEDTVTKENVVTEEEPPVEAEKLDESYFLAAPVEADAEENVTFVEPSVQNIETAEKKEITVSQPQVTAAAVEINQPVSQTESSQNAEQVSVENNAEEEVSVTENNNSTEETIAEDNSASNSVDIFKNPSMICPSRQMTVKNNQYVDVVYPGNGWIFIGETESEPKFRYFGRKLGSADTTFTLRSIKPGKTYLHFYKNDVLTAQYIDDYLEVEVLSETAKPNEKAKAPSYSEVVPPKPVRAVTQITADNSTAEEKSVVNSKKTVTEKKTDFVQKTADKTQSKTDVSPAEDKDVKTIIQSADKSVSAKPETISQPAKTETQPAKQISQSPEIEHSSPDTSKSLLEQAKDSLNKKNYEQALSQIQSYLDKEDKKIDEALFIQGQILEADSPVKNIRNAIDSYSTLIKKYPGSKFWQKANKRKIFLDRFYVNIY